MAAKKRTTRKTTARKTTTRKTTARKTTKRKTTARKSPVAKVLRGIKKALAGTKKKPAKRTSARGRERIDTTPRRAGGSRYVRRGSAGRFTADQVAVGRSLAADRRTKAKTKAPKGQKDRGD